MNDVRITPRGQLLTLVALLATVLAAVVAQAPEIRRYLKMRSM